MSLFTSYLTKLPFVHPGNSESVGEVFKLLGWGIIMYSTVQILMQSYVGSQQDKNKGNASNTPLLSWQGGEGNSQSKQKKTKR